MIKKCEMERGPGVSQLYIRQTLSGKIILMPAEITDDIFLAGNIHEITSFYKLISKQYNVSKIIIDNQINFNGCNITQDSRGNIIKDMSRFLFSLQLVKIRKSSDEVQA